MGVAQLRPVPYPYKAMLAICSDLDGTPDQSRYLEIARFLNSEENTSIGKGVGLEVGNTIYFDMPKNQFAYWNTDHSGRQLLRALIRSGHIDCFHSFGDLAATRNDAVRALEELETHNCRIECWVDHSTAPTNLGADIMQGSGDIPGSPVYHADLTYRHGVRFVWRGRVTSVIGQDRPRSITGLLTPEHPLSSARTAAKEFAKGVLGRIGNSRFAMHASNDLARRIELRDGHKVFEFIRCNPHWAGVSTGDTADGLGDLLTESFLRRLIKRRASCILYTHLSKNRKTRDIFPTTTIRALHKLARFVHDRDVLVTTTRRMLGYWLSRRRIESTMSRDSAYETIKIETSCLTSLDVPVDLAGLTFYVDDSSSARIYVDDVEVPDLRRNPADECGKQSVSIPWKPLVFPTL